MYATRRNRPARRYGGRKSMNRMGLPIARRDFLPVLSAGGAGALTAVGGARRGLLDASALLEGSRDRLVGMNPLRLAPESVPDGLTLTAAQGLADFGGGEATAAWMLNDSLPSPLLRVRRGNPFR